MRRKKSSKKMFLPLSQNLFTSDEPDYLVGKSSEQFLSVPTNSKTPLNHRRSLQNLNQNPLNESHEFSQTGFGMSKQTEQSRLEIQKYPHQAVSMLNIKTEPDQVEIPTSGFKLKKAKSNVKIGKASYRFGRDSRPTSQGGWAFKRKSSIALTEDKSTHQSITNIRTLGSHTARNTARENIQTLMDSASFQIKDTKRFLHTYYHLEKNKINTV